MEKYILMHKDIPCASVVFDEDTKRAAAYQNVASAYTPFLGNCDKRKFGRWWEIRAIPASRELMQRVIRQAGCINAESYLAKNLALSMTDTYWICPADSELKYEDVKLTNLVGYNSGKLPYHNESSYDPNASLGGQMEKYWDLTQQVPVLVKESYRDYGQQALNEVFATKLHERQQTDIPYVSYSAEKMPGGGYSCKCEAFTSDTAELIPAYEVIESRPAQNDRNNYQTYIDIAVSLGADRECMQKYMDYQTMTDFILSNTDEHLLNFGLLRDPDTGKILGPAPIFDTGNSMFFSEYRNKPYTRAELLQRPITGFYKTEEKMLASVKDPSVVHVELLPKPEEAGQFYAENGVPEEKAEFISRNYRIKVEMAKEMQKECKISLYHEKKKEKAKG